MTYAGQSTDEPTEYSVVGTKKYVQTKLQNVLQITNEDNTHIQKTRNDLITECTNCISNEQKTDIFTHCESIKRMLVILNGYKQIINCSEISEKTSLCEILTLPDIYTLPQITDDFIHIKDHMDHNKTSAKELARKFREQLKNSSSIHRRVTHTTTFANQDDILFQQELQKIYSYLTHIDLYNSPDMDYHIPCGGKFKQYIGKKEDDQWWKYKVGQTDEDIYFNLIQKMGVFRWQSFHGFGSKQHHGLMHLRPKYNNVKEEALYNPYHPLSKDNWNQTLRKAKIFYNSFARHRIKSVYNGKYDDKITQETTIWKQGETIDMSEIVTFKLYTDFDKLQYELKRCFRFETMSDVFTLNNFDPESKLEKCIFESHENKIRYLLEKRLRTFYWWRVKLLATLSKYSKKLDPNVPLYHGVNAKMILNNCRKSIAFCGPLSTSSSYHVARTFATAKGTVLEVTTQFPQLNLCRAFDVSLISDYPEENEHLISFAYLKINKVFTRPLNKNWKTFQDMDNDKNGYNIPLSSITKAIFFAVHLFRQQIFSMSVQSEYWLTAFLYLFCGFNENDDNKDNGCIKKTKFVDKLERIMMENECKECDEPIHDVVRQKTILKILCDKFENFRKFPNRSQILKINVDRMSMNLKPYFMDFCGKDIYNKERFIVSKSKIIKIYPNIKKIKLEYDDYRKNSNLFVDFERSVKSADNVELSKLKVNNEKQNIGQKEIHSSDKKTENRSKTINNTLTSDTGEITNEQLRLSAEVSTHNKGKHIGQMQLNIPQLKQVISDGYDSEDNELEIQDKLDL